MKELELAGPHQRLIPSPAPLMHGTASVAVPHFGGGGSDHSPRIHSRQAKPPRTAPVYGREASYVPN
jgi:hypothetical protein